MKIEEMKEKATPFLSKAKALGSRAIEYVKTNPRDAAYDLAAIAIAAALLDIDDVLEDIESHTELSAAIDLENFWNS